MKKKSIYLLLFLGSIAVVISTYRGVKNALQMSFDLQWSPSVFFLKGGNPYAEWIDGNLNNEIILGQVPNYLHGLYYVLTPLALLNFYEAKIVWVVLNILLGVCISLFICQFFKLSKIASLIFFVLFVCSTSFRNVLGNGQMSLFVMFFLILPFYMGNKNWVFLIQGIGFSKYSFAPPFFIYNLFKFGVFKSALSLFFAIFFLLIFSIQFAINPFESLLLPLRVASTGVNVGSADIMSLFEAFLGKNTIYTGILGISLSFAVCWAAIRSNCMRKELAQVSIVSLLCFKHLIYDFVFLAPVLAFLFVTKSSFKHILSLVIVFWFWFGLRILEVIIPKLASLPNFELYTILGNFSLLCILLISISKINSARD